MVLLEKGQVKATNKHNLVEVQFVKSGKGVPRTFS